MHTKEQEERLPKWAKLELETLRMRIEEGQKRLEEVLGKVEESDTKFDLGYRHGVGREWQNLPKGGTVRFVLGKDHREEIEIRVMREKERDGKPLIQVMGGDMLAVFPHSGNVVQIGLVGR
jgi:hypothetical protein